MTECILTWIKYMVFKMLAVQWLSSVRLSVTSLTIARQAPPSVGFPRQEYWSGLPVSFSRGIFLIQGLNPLLLHWQEPPGKLYSKCYQTSKRNNCNKNRTSTSLIDVHRQFISPISLFPMLKKFENLSETSECLVTDWFSTLLSFHT